jgi:hypothetical protein
MRTGAMIGVVALCLLAAPRAGAQECDGCKWYVIVSFATPGTRDLYAGGNSREDCEPLAAQVRGAAAVADVTIECVDSSRLDAWFHDHAPDPWPSK